MAEMTFSGAKVIRNFDTFSEAEAFQDGIKVLSGMLGEHTRVYIGPVMPLELKGYTTTITLERELESVDA